MKYPYLARCEFIGTEVEIRRGDEMICGVARDMTSDGALEIINATGKRCIVTVGEMFGSFFAPEHRS